MELRIVEVGPRDGLQNERTPIPTIDKVQFIADLVASGLREIEVTSFVSPKWVPQLGDAAELWPQLPPGGPYSALVPNAKGLERALSVGVSRIAVFTAASDAFTQKNINVTVAESISGFGQVLRTFREAHPQGWVRGYVSTAFECPYAGRVEPGRAVEVANQLWELGCSEISFGDTIGVASPREVGALAREVELNFAGPHSAVAWHFHDTNGTGVANVSRALELGASVFDSSAGGLGGCPYAPGAGGNLATEDLVYLLEREGVPTGVDLDRLIRASLPVLELLGRKPTSKAQLAVMASASAP